MQWERPADMVHSSFQLPAPMPILSRTFLGGVRFACLRRFTTITSTTGCGVAARCCSMRAGHACCIPCPTCLLLVPAPNELLLTGLHAALKGTRMMALYVCM